LRIVNSGSVLMNVLYLKQTLKTWRGFRILIKYRHANI
jgi:hypothetical protein